MGSRAEDDVKKMRKIVIAIIGGVILSVASGLAGSLSVQSALNAGNWLQSQSSYSNPAPSMQNALTGGTWTSRQMSGAGHGSIPPCAVVTDLSLPAMSREWAASMAQPYTTFMEEKFQIMLKQKREGGILDATQLFNRYGEFDRMSARGDKDIVKMGNSKLDWLKRVTGLGDIRAPEKKLAILRMQATAIIFAGGKETYGLAEETDRLIRKYTPMQFDYASRHQVIKDMVKMAGIQSRTQAQTLRLLSHIRIQEALAKR